VRPHEMTPDRNGAPPGAAIRIQGLTRDFGSLRALDDVSLEVPAGTAFGLLGPNGAGKTTMIRLLLGLLAPTAGTASVLGWDTRTHSAEIRVRTGALLEHTGLYERLSAEDNLDFYARVWRLPAAQRRARIRELLEAMGLWDRRGDQVGSWSRGMRQKLAVARALLHRPSLLFLDEPTAGLDPRAAFELRQQLAAIVADQGASVFLTTHNLAEAEYLCSTIGVIRKGRLVAVGAPEQLRRAAAGDRVEILGGGFAPSVVASLRERPEIAGAEATDGCLVLHISPDCRVGPFIALLVQAGADVEEVRRPRATLEEVFLSLTQEDAP
jgi:ABC-2 type transport system ATP-binding protein